MTENACMLLLWYRLLFDYTNIGFADIQTSYFGENCCETNFHKEASHQNTLVGAIIVTLMLKVKLLKHCSTRFSHNNTA